MRPASYLYASLDISPGFAVLCSLVRPLRDNSLFSIVASLCAIAITCAARPAVSQTNAQASTSGALERFQPSAPGDALFGVPSPAIGGSLVPRGVVAVDFAHLPLSIQDGSTRHVIVSDQLF